MSKDHSLRAKRYQPDHIRFLPLNFNSKFMKKTLLIVTVFIIVLILSFRIKDALDSPELKSTTCLENYTQEELDFVSEVGFRYHDRASKWEKDITVSIKGNPRQSDVLLICLLYTSDAADDLLCVDLGGRRI